MSINSIGGFGQHGGMRVAFSGPPPAGRSPLDAVSGVLGMKTDEIAGALSQGKSLDDLAKAQGVSHADLVSALRQGLPSDAPQGVDTDSMIEAITQQKGLPAPPSGAGPRPSQLQGIGQVTGVFGSSMSSSQDQMLKDLSSLLGTSTDDLMSTLRSGSSSLADLVSSKGVDRSSLAAILQNGLLIDTRA